MEKFKEINLPSVLPLHPLFITHKPADLVITTGVREKASSHGRSDSKQSMLAECRERKDDCAETI